MGLLKLGAVIFFTGGVLTGSSLVLIVWQLEEQGSILGPILNLIVGVGLSIVGFISIRAACQGLKSSQDAGGSEAA